MADDPTDMIQTVQSTRYPASNIVSNCQLWLLRCDNESAQSRHRHISPSFGIRFLGYVKAAGARIDTGHLRFVAQLNRSYVCPILPTGTRDAGTGEGGRGSGVTPTGGLSEDETERAFEVSVKVEE